MVRAVWFMDVDGVISPFGKSGAFNDWIQSPHDEYDLWLSPIQVGLIGDILTRTGAELIWVTTWADEVAEHVEEVLGWSQPRWVPLPTPAIKGGDRGPSGRWWKLDAVEDLLEELQPDRFVWSDDDHPQHHAAIARRSLVTGPPTPFASKGVLGDCRKNHRRSFTCSRDTHSLVGPVAGQRIREQQDSRRKRNGDGCVGPRTHTEDAAAAR